MSNTADNIRSLIQTNQIEQAIEQLRSVDGVVYALFKHQLLEHQREYALGLVVWDQSGVYRTRIAHRLLMYLELCTQSAFLPQKHPPASTRESGEAIQEFNAQYFILPIEKTLIQQHLDMEKPIPASSPKIMTFYFLERKELAISGVLDHLEQYRQEGHPNMVRLLWTLRESEYALRELYDVLHASGFGPEPITQTARKCADICMKLRGELTPAALKKASVRSDMEDAEIFLSRVLRQIHEIKSSAGRFSES